MQNEGLIAVVSIFNLFMHLSANPGHFSGRLESSPYIDKFKCLKCDQDWQESEEIDFESTPISFLLLDHSNKTILI